MVDRKKYNKLILETLSKLVDKYPDLRFGQLLVNCGILKISENFIGESNDGKQRNYIVEDPFYEEPEVMLKRMVFND